MYIDYFYGNKGFLWRIINDIYQDRGYDFFSGEAQENVAQIKRWQNDYCVALSDTIIECSRKHPLSTNDSDLVDIYYNHDLKKYILAHIGEIEKIIFTSSYGKNSAFENFKIIMGDELPRVAHALITGLPSPSGSANITFFNSRNEDTLGLTKDFYEYVRDQHPHLLEEFKYRWHIKKTRQSSAENRMNFVVPPTPKGLVTQFKLWKYRQALPSTPCKN